MAEEEVEVEVEVIVESVEEEPVVSVDMAVGLTDAGLVVRTSSDDEEEETPG